MAVMVSVASSRVRAALLRTLVSRGIELGKSNPNPKPSPKPYKPETLKSAALRSYRVLTVLI